jgi:hypothetical protein
VKEQVMKRRKIAVGLAALFAAQAVAGSLVLAASKAEQAREAARLVQETLQREAYAGIADRSEVLRPAIAKAPGCEPALWYSGFVYDAKRRQWLRYDEVRQSAAKDWRLSAYRAARGRYPQTVEGQLELARWCAGRGLADQARAHLSRVLELDPNHVQARELLGFQKINGSWVSREELSQADQRARRAQAALAEWQPKLEKLRQALVGGNRRQSELARQKLKAIDSPDAVGAVEQTFCAAEGELALLGVEILKNIRGAESAAALAWQGLFAAGEPVREAAAEALQPRGKHEYVPLLLSAMSTPVQSRAAMYQLPDGRLLYRHFLYRETQDHRELAVFDTPYQHTVPGAAAPAAVPLESLRGVPLDTRVKAAAHDTAAAVQNRAIDNLNQRLFAVLALATGEDRPRTPAEWWRWWDDENEVFSDEDKPTGTYYEEDREVHYDPPIITGNQKDCLAPGTPAWTELGPRPIESIAVGDRVFSCDPETGCLALKPVLRATVRPKGILVRVRTEGETIETSGGHVFWIAGRGWVKARELEPGMRCHTLTGTVPIETVEKGSTQATYNLVVADFHTYFAGRQRVLTHDNTVRRPTRCIVPGLVK